MRATAERTRNSALLLCGALLASCAGGGGNTVDITKPITGEAATNASRAYQQGLDEKNRSSFVEATRYFEWVRNNFPYSQYAALSELALADMGFERGDFAAAATAFQDFVKAHPSHPKAAYASFHAGLSNYQDKPSDWFLLPPAHEKDQGPIKTALDSLQRFTLGYPKSEFVPKARELIADCRERLAAHERYVADFYWKREAWKGAAGRLLTLADTYGDLNGGKTRGDSLWRAAAAYRNAKDPGNEREVLKRLVQEAPGDPHRGEAEARLKTIPNEPPKPAAEQKPAGEAKDAPITPAETPSAPAERPQAAPSPGQPGGQEPAVGSPEMKPKPRAPTNQPPTPPEQPVSQPETPPLAQPDK